MQKTASDKHVGAHHLKDRLIIYIRDMVLINSLKGMMIYTIVNHNELTTLNMVLITRLRLSLDIGIRHF
jgi:hypothetical protein